MKNLVQKFTRTKLLAVSTAMLIACGGGGGGGGGEATPAGATPVVVNTPRTGTMLYTYLSQLLAVEMSTGTTRVVSKLLRLGNRDFVGASVGPAGEIVMGQTSGSTLENLGWVVILKPDGSEERSLQIDYILNGRPVISPDGSSIAVSSSFHDVRATPSTRNFTLVLSRTTGENLLFGENYGVPLWTPDGRLLLRKNDGVYIAEVKVGGTITLIPNSQSFYDYSLSPDGKKIAFVRSPTTAGVKHVYMMNIDGSGLRQVTTSNTRDETGVHFSPDGNSLMVTTYGCISVYDGPPYTIGSIYTDLIHVIPASSSMLELVTINNLATTALLQESGTGRCTGGTLSWG